jgi:methylmalonyl-CoA epimerase
VQALKAGIMEIADIFVVNKADREGADRAAAAIENMLSLAPGGPDAARPPVLLTEATTARGVPELIEAIHRFRTRTPSRLDERRRARADWRLREILARRFMQDVERRALGPAQLDQWLTRITQRELDPYEAADMILGSMSITPRGDYSLDHVGIAVKDATGPVALFKEMFDLDCDDAEIVGSHRLRFIATGEATIELVEPLSTDSPIARFLETRGPGLHHVCLRVADIDAALARLKAKGARLIDAEARPGAHGSRIAFLHPAGTGGVLIEIKQR